jgi:V/A-type H+-transporting ATPase subunit I
MLKPVEMEKVRAICLKTSAPSVIKALHNLSVLHVSESEIPETERSGPLASYDDISSRLTRIRSLREAMGTAAFGKAAPEEGRPRKKREFASPLKEADGALAGAEKLFALLKEKDEIARELEANLASQKAAAELGGLEVDFSELKAESLQFSLLRCAGRKAAEAAAGMKSKGVMFTYSEEKGRGAVFLIAQKKGEEAKFLEQFGALSPLPSIATTPRKEGEKLRQKEQELRERLAAAEKKAATHSKAHYAEAAALEEALLIEADRAQIATRFRATDSLYFLEGWVEEAKFGALEAEMARRFGKRVYVMRAHAGHEEMPPTLLDNPKQAKPFEFLVEFISLPQYAEIDPTMILAFTVPLTYALIFGDAGYAVMSFVLAMWMVKISKPGSLFRNVALLWAISAIPTFILGIAFDEYFGFTHAHFFSIIGFGEVHLYEGFSRLHSVTGLMAVTLVVGTLQLALGLVLGAINEWGHGRRHAYAKMAWLGVLFGGFFLVASGMYSLYPFLLVPAAALFALSVVALLITEGAISVIEIPGLLGNVMSYVRIAAIGLSGLILAETINSMLMPKFELSLVGIAAFLLTSVAYVGVHVAACIIAMFESLVQGARLNVVEFFGKFYKGNGIRFSPFAASRKYTVEAS